MSYFDKAVASLRNGDAFKFSHTVIEDRSFSSKAINPKHFQRSELLTNGIWWYDNLLELFNEGHSKRIINDLIVHGSYGDFTQTHFSDLELTIQVSDECFRDSDKSKLLKKWIEKSVNPLLINVDPLQHHGCFFLWSDVISCYDENYLPLAAYDECWSIRGKSIELKVLKDNGFTEKSRKKLNSTIVSLENYFSVYFRYGVNLYSIKKVLSNFCMLPVFLYQADGMMLSKKDALKKIKAEPISDSFDKALDIATQLRSDWPKQEQWKRKLGRVFVKTEIPQGRMDLIVCNLFRDLAIDSSFFKEFLPTMQDALHDLRANVL